MPKIFIYGTGGFAREVALILWENGDFNRFGGFVDLDITISKLGSQTIMNKPVLTEDQFLSLSESSLVIGVGAPHIREKIVRSLPANTHYESVIHHSVKINPWINIGNGSVICAGSILTVNISLGAHTHLNLDTTIGHDVSAGDYFTTAPSVNVSGECKFGDRVYLGTGSATRQGLNIANDVVVGMGAMLVKSAIDSGTYVGIPAKLLTK